MIPVYKVADWLLLYFCAGCPTINLNFKLCSKSEIRELVNSNIYIGLTHSDSNFRNQNVPEGAILFFWNQYSNIVRKKLSN